MIAVSKEMVMVITSKEDYDAEAKACGYQYNWIAQLPPFFLYAHCLHICLFSSRTSLGRNEPVPTKTQSIPSTFMPQPRACNIYYFMLWKRPSVGRKTVLTLLNMMNQATPTDKNSHVLDISIWAIWCGLGSSAPLFYRGQALNVSQSVLLEPGDWRSFCEVGVLKNKAGAGVVSRWL